MLGKVSLLGAPAWLLLGLATAPMAQAATAIVDMTGWHAVGDLSNPGNSFALPSLGVGSTILGFEYVDLRFTTTGTLTYLADLVLSVNGDEDANGNLPFMDWQPSVVDATGGFGPTSGVWGGVDGIAPIYGAGGSFATASGSVIATVYLQFSSGGSIAIDSGEMHINYAPVPEPASYGLMALGLLAVGAIVRRRRD